MYNQKVLDIFRNPINAGGLQGANGVAKCINETFGDTVKIYLKINEDEVIEQARFKTMGCVASITCSSVLTQIVTKKSLDEALELTSNNILDVIGSLPEDKLQFCDLCISALKDAILDYYKRKEKELAKQNKNM